LEFAPAIAKARYRILETNLSELGPTPLEAAFKSSQWALPVLYNRYDPVEVRPSENYARLGEDLARLGERHFLEQELEKRRQRGIPDDDPMMLRITLRIAELTSETRGAAP
jgi:hypothetical protein